MSAAVADSILHRLAPAVGVAAGPHGERLAEVGHPAWRGLARGLEVHHQFGGHLGRDFLERPGEGLEGLATADDAGGDGGGLFDMDGLVGFRRGGRGPVAVGGVVHGASEQRLADGDVQLPGELQVDGLEDRQVGGGLEAQRRFHPPAADASAGGLRAQQHPAAGDDAQPAVGPQAVIVGAFLAVERPHRRVQGAEEHPVPAARVRPASARRHRAQVLAGDQIEDPGLGEHLTVDDGGVGHVSAVIAAAVGGRVPQHLAGARSDAVHVIRPTRVGQQHQLVAGVGQEVDNRLARGLEGHFIGRLAGGGVEGDEGLVAPEVAAAALDEVDPRRCQRDRRVDDGALAVLPEGLAGGGVQGEQAAGTDLAGGGVVVPSAAAPPVGPGRPRMGRAADEHLPLAADEAPVMALADDAVFLDHGAGGRVDLPAAIGDHRPDEILIRAPVAAVVGHVHADQPGNLQRPEDRAVVGVDGDDALQPLGEQPSAGGQGGGLAGRPIRLIARPRPAHPLYSELRGGRRAGQFLSAVRRVGPPAVLVGPYARALGLRLGVLNGLARQHRHAAGLEQAPRLALGIAAGLAGHDVLRDDQVRTAAGQQHVVGLRRKPQGNPLAVSARLDQGRPAGGDGGRVGIEADDPHAAALGQLPRQPPVPAAEDHADAGFHLRRLENVLCGGGTGLCQVVVRERLGLGADSRKGVVEEHVDYAGLGGPQLPSDRRADNVRVAAAAFQAGQRGRVHGRLLGVLDLADGVAAAVFENRRRGLGRLPVHDGLVRIRELHVRADRQGQVRFIDRAHRLARFGGQRFGDGLAAGAEAIHVPLVRADDEPAVGGGQAVGGAVDRSRPELLAVGGVGRDDAILASAEEGVLGHDHASRAGQGNVPLGPPAALGTDEAGDAAVTRGESSGGADDDIIRSAHAADGLPAVAGAVEYLAAVE